jgi:hypothetical protein
MEDYTINEGLPAKRAEEDSGDPEAQAFARQRYHARLAHSFRLRAQDAKGHERKDAIAAHKFHTAKVNDTITFIKKLREDTDLMEDTTASHEEVTKAIHKAFKDHSKDPGYIRHGDAGHTAATKHSPSFDNRGFWELRTKGSLTPALKKLAKKYGGKYDSQTGHLDIRTKTHRHFVSTKHGTAHSVYSHFHRPLSDYDMRNEELEEKVLDIQARMKRAAVMRRYENKIQRSKEMAQRRIAPEKNIKKRAYSAARQILRRKVAGARGAEYAQMGPSEKMAIDRLIDGKAKVVKKIALRLMPKVRAAEHTRLASFMKGAALESQHSSPSATMESVDKKINKKFGDKFKKGDTPSATEKKEVQLYPKDPKSVVKFHQKFSEEAALESDTFKGLCKKAEKSGIDLDILGEVYDRGMDAWVEEMNVSQQQYAFARVNSYINQGKSYFNEDADLQELSKGTLRSYLDKASTRGQLPTAAKFRRSVIMGTVAAKKVGQRFPGSKNVTVKVKATNEETVPLVEEDGKTTVVSKGKESGTRWEMRTRLAGEPGEWSAIVKTHQDGKHLQNKWGGYNVYKTGKTSYIKKHFDKLALKEETLTEQRGYKAPELEAAGYKFKSHMAASSGHPASTLYHHPELDKHIEITHERTGLSGAKKKFYFYSGKFGGMQSMHHNLNDAILKNKGGTVKEETLDEANRLKYDASAKQWYHSANSGFTWKRVTSDEAKKAYPGKHKDITAEHGLKEEVLNEATAHERVKNHPAVESIDNGGKGEYFVCLKHPYHWSGQKSFGVDSPSHALKMLKAVKKGTPGVDFEEEYVTEMSWPKQVQYVAAAKKDRLDKFNKSMATKDPAEKAALLKRVANRGEAIQKVMDRSGWNRRKPVEEAVALDEATDPKNRVYFKFKSAATRSDSGWRAVSHMIPNEGNDKLGDHEVHHHEVHLKNGLVAHTQASHAFQDGTGRPLSIRNAAARLKKPVEEAVFTVDKEPVIVPPEKKEDGTFKPARTVMRRVRKKILNSGNLSDGK